MRITQVAESSERATMSRYYQLQAHIYDATRRLFLFGRQRIVDELRILPGDTVLEVGCGTGHNFERILQAVGENGRLIGVDCSAPMLEKCRARIREQNWQNVSLLDEEYGIEPLGGGNVDVVLMSYSLSMIRDWREALACARAELREGGRVGVVDFCLESKRVHSVLFARWLAVNHVDADRPYGRALRQLFRTEIYAPQSVCAGLWTYFRFVGTR